MSPDQAQKLQYKCDRAGRDLFWLVVEDHGRFIARPLTADGVLRATLIADSLMELRLRLPVGLVRSDIQPWEFPPVVEVWHPVNLRLSPG